MGAGDGWLCWDRVRREMGSRRCAGGWVGGVRAAREGNLGAAVGIFNGAMGGVTLGAAVWGTIGATVGITLRAGTGVGALVGATIGDVAGVGTSVGGSP